MSWIQTYTGKKFDLIDPQPDMVDIFDIAHSLSHLCRFTGHTRAFYSVAQHSVLCYSVVLNVSPEDGMSALLHDATEAYVNDLARPLKWLLPEYKTIENRVWAAICTHFDLPEKLPASVKEADNRLLMTERRDLMGNPPAPWVPELEALEPYSAPILPASIVVAETMFLQSYQAARQARNEIT